MKRDEVLGYFPEATEEQISGILNQVGSELNPLKSRLEKAEAERDEARGALEESRASEAGYKARLDEAEAKVEEGMSAEERMAARETAADEREREFAVKSNALDAKEIFVEAGCFAEDELAELVEQVSSEDGDATRARAKRIVDTVARQREAAAKEAKDAALRGNPKLEDGGDGESAGPATLKDFLELPLERQMALKEGNPDILSQLK